MMNMNNPYEENLQKPLEKYGRDITKAAKDGKQILLQVVMMK